MATAVAIPEADIREFLEGLGFKEVKLDGTRELVMGRVVDKDICLRVYTSVVQGESRGVGEDAIRCVLVARVSKDGGDEGVPIIRLIGSDKRVHRVVGWRLNLRNRIDNWEDMLGPRCPTCGRPTAKRRSKRGPFWGCVGYPVCRGSVDASEE